VATPQIGRDPVTRITPSLFVVLAGGLVQCGSSDGTGAANPVASVSTYVTTGTSVATGTFSLTDGGVTTSTWTLTTSSTVTTGGAMGSASGSSSVGSGTGTAAGGCTTSYCTTALACTTVYSNGETWSSQGAQCVLPDRYGCSSGSIWFEPAECTTRITITTTTSTNVACTYGGAVHANGESFACGACGTCTCTYGEVVDSHGYLIASAASCDDGGTRMSDASAD
jgi:hypothetical protein